MGMTNLYQHMVTLSGTSGFTRLSGLAAVSEPSGGTVLVPLIGVCVIALAERFYARKCRAPRVQVVAPRHWVSVLLVSSRSPSP
jgi:hypothetical protein